MKLAVVTPRYGDDIAGARRRRRGSSRPTRGSARRGGSTCSPPPRGDATTGPTSSPPGPIRRRRRRRAPLSLWNAHDAADFDRLCARLLYRPAARVGRRAGRWVEEQGPYSPAAHRRDRGDATPTSSRSTRTSTTRPSSGSRSSRAASGAASGRARRAADPPPDLPRDVRGARPASSTGARPSGGSPSGSSRWPPDPSSSSGSASSPNRVIPRPRVAAVGIGDAPFLFCLGRVDDGKGRACSPSASRGTRSAGQRPLKLVYAGPGDRPATAHPDIVIAGRVDEDVKWGLLRGARRARVAVGLRVVLDRAARGVERRHARRS